MARLPIPGADNNNWGTVLNDYLLQTTVDTNLFSYSPTNGDGTLNIAPTNPAAGGGTNFNLATTGYPGLVQLAGDLAGTYSSPALTNVITAGGPTGSSTQVPVITWDAKGRLTAVSTASITGGVQRTFPFFVS